MHPKILSVVETHRAGQALATVRLEVELVDLPALLAPCDISAIAETAGFDKAMDAALALDKIREAENDGRRRRHELELAAANKPVRESKAKSGQELVDHVVGQVVAREEGAGS